MLKRWVDWMEQHQVAILVAGVLVVIGVLAAAIVAASLWNPPGGGRQGVTTPILISTPDTGGGGARVEAGVVSSGYAAEGESSGQDLRVRLSEGQPALQEVAYLPVARGDEGMLDFLDSWIELKRRDRTLDRLFDYWMRGRDEERRQPRWSVIRDVLHWVE